MQNNTQKIEENKIDLSELFFILKKRTKIIWSVTGLFTLLALIYTFTSKPIYEAKSMIHTAEINSKPVEDINDLKQSLEYIYQVNIKNKKVGLPRISKISIPKKTSNIIEIVAIGYSNEDTANKIQAVIKKIEISNNEKTETYINAQKHLLELVLKDIGANLSTLQKMQKELNKYNHKIITLKSDDAALASIYAIQIGQKQMQLENMKRHISNLKEKEQKLQLSISPLHIKSAQVIGAIETYDKAVKPKKELIIIISFISGLMISIFLVFFLEFLQGMKEEESD